MKKFIFLILLFLSAFSFNANGQIKVFNNNYVGINFSTVPLSRFVINAAGNSAYQAWIYNPNISTTGAALATISEQGTGSGNNILSLLGQTYIGSSNYLYGIKGNAYSSTTFTTGRTYGLYGEAGNAATGYNYGVYGYLYGTQYGAAVFGTINGLGDVGLTQQWAGYFRGDVKIENTLWVGATAYYSDIKFKTNITSLESSETLSKILKINPIKYNLKQFEIKATGGDTIKVSKYYNETDQLFIKAKYGVIAQELLEIYPDLVYTDGEGNLGVDYIGLVPILIKAVQEQQKKIEDLEVLINSLKKQ
jgi:hypothetical protein